MPRGSKPGEHRGGRKTGTLNKRTVVMNQLREEALTAGITPLEVMLKTMRGFWKVGKKMEAADIAKDAAPYLHPRLAARDVAVQIKGLTGSLSEQGQAIVKAMGNGELTPSQAASMLQAIAAQARVVEVDDLLRRVASLEQQLGGNHGQRA